MDYIKKQLCLLIMCMPLLLRAQENTGIQWTTGLSFDQVKQKAKAENKYIFLDVFATWCGPCKEMDKYVYPNDTVGKYFNDKFISVKVQTDKTKNDNDFVKSWYNDAAAVKKQYWIEAYPSFIFLKPDGNIVYRGSSYQGVNKLIALAQEATKPGKVYDDPFAEYYLLLADYKQGLKKYDRMPYMIKTAYKLGEAEFGKQLLEEHTEYVKQLKPKDRYTKESIQMWSSFHLKTDGPRFQFFYKEGNLIDKVMSEKGYADEIVDKSIMIEFIEPFYEEQNKSKSIAMSGMYVGGTGLKSDSSEADWLKLEKMLQTKFSRVVAKRNVLAAKVEWYRRHNNKAGEMKYILIRFKEYPWQTKSWELNIVAWNAFNKINDRASLYKAIRYTKKGVKIFSDDYNLIDTYANLLYKVGRKSEAIEWEQKAISMAIKVEGSQFDIDEFKKAVEQMEKGESTYGIQPLK